MFSLEGQTALVTGGTRGIGQAAAVALAEGGADVVLIQRDRTNTATQQAIEALGRKATIYTADLSSPAEVAALTPAVLEDGHKIHVLVNCAGIQRRHPCAQFPDSDWNEGGLTVPAYAASKGAVAQLTKSLANEWAAKGIAVNAIAPGYIDTDMNRALLADPDRLRSISERIPAGRWGVPDDFKGSVLFLASAASSYVSGHVLVVDGGWMGRQMVNRSTLFSLDRQEIASSPVPRYDPGWKSFRMVTSDVCLLVPPDL
ncbi:2-deoxy-d-gluconate 3-dehydrogenase [Marssonina coronariae]|uniref:2-deoxy-d-gluconate 3-dehydrogenase n=1 Tax=Diplocarpon coronariae TaxID=2795749 RepID=A0A218ZHV8_9HELO|nr:2-deoxy-d-gluconate 3-dehydrogenase [Marssonina coronariae]